MMWGQSGMYHSVMTADGCTPKQIMEGVACANAGVNRATIVKTDGSLWTWGAGHLGQLGDGKYSVTRYMHYNLTPTKIMDGFSASVQQAEPAPDTPSSWATEQVNAAIAAGLVPESLKRITQAWYRAVAWRRCF